MKKSPARFLCVILAAALLLTALPLTVHAEGNVFYVSTAEELADACSDINNGNGGTYTIELTDNIENGYIGISNGDAVVTVFGNGHTIDRRNSIGAGISPWYGATINLGSSNGGEKNALTVVGGVDNDYPGIVYVLANSACNMYDNVTLKDHKGQNFYGGGVTVEGGTFHMYGGTIDNCCIDGGSISYGGGVAVIAGGTFIMDNGTITNCYAKSDYAYTWEDYDAFLENGKVIDPRYTVTASGGGVFVAGGSSFIMNNGTISNNTVLNTDGGMAYGGGVAMMITLDERNTPDVLGTMGNPQSTVTINGGTITGNQAECGGGIYATGYYYTYYGSIGALVPEDGATMNPGLYISGGEISSNTATDAGGGIFASFLCPWNRANNNDWKGFKTQIHNATIKNNTADNGAGIESYGYWTQTDIDGCTITGNSATTNGGGIALFGNTSSGLTRLKNSTVTGNTSGDIGAGVLYDSQSLLYISGADIIQDNTYNGKLNNLNILDKDHPVYVNGALTGSKIGLSDPTLWGDDLEDYDAAALSTEYLTSGYKTYNPEVHPSEYFTSDHESWVVDRSVKTTTTVEDPDSAYRVYTVEKHPVESIGLYIPAREAYYAPYSGNKDQYEISDIENPIVQSISSEDNDEDYFKNIYNELKYRYETLGKYTISDSTDLSRGIIYITCTPTDSNSPLSQITIKKQNNESSVTIVYSSSPLPKNGMMRGNNVTYTTSKSIQRKYPDTNKLVLQITSNGTSTLNDTYYRFSDDYTTPTLVYIDDEPPATTSVFYEYDKETGDIKAKLIPISCETKYARSTTTESGTDDEVRLVRADINYHINNEVIDDEYGNSDIFTDEVAAFTGKEVKVGEKIDSFYLIPEAKTTKQNSCPYIFKGWYYDKDNENDSRPVVFGTDHYSKDIYAHWITVDDVAKDSEDEFVLPPTYTQYGGFDLVGVQIRKEMRDYNFEDVPKKPGGMRFITSLSMDVVRQVNALKAGGNNIEYGYVAATNAGWIDYHKKTEDRKLLYVSDSEPHPNGIDTASNDATNENYFGFAKNVDCTSRLANKNGVVPLDHQNYDGYLLYSLVITYEGENADYGKNVLARPYIKYTDANGLVRVAYSDYRGTNVIGGCYTNYNAISKN